MTPTAQDPTWQPSPPRADIDPDISVVIPTARRSTRLALTLAALRHQALPPDRFEVLVVDDAPDEGWVEEATTCVPPVAFPLYILPGAGHGPGAARNLGARSARSDILLFLDDDTLLTRDVLVTHLAEHRSDGGRRRVVHGAIADLTAFALTADARPVTEELVGIRDRRLRIVDLADLPQIARHLAPRRSLIEKLARTVTAHPSYRSLAWLACVGTNTSIRRALFERVRGFDEEYGRRWGGEDLELGFRLAAEEAEFTLADAPAYHLFRSRPQAGAALPEFWQLVADRHGIAELADVADLLLGQIGLDDLARRLECASVPVQASARQRGDHSGHRPADPA